MFVYNRKIISLFTEKSKNLLNLIYLSADYFNALIIMIIIILSRVSVFKHVSLCRLTTEDRLAIEEWITYYDKRFR